MCNYNIFLHRSRIANAAVLGCRSLVNIPFASLIQVWIIQNFNDVLMSSQIIIR